MTKLSQTIFDHYQTRKTKQQKEKFRHLIKEELAEQNIPVREEVSGKWIKNHNLIIGDVDSSDMILTAHYDTAAVLLIPNLIFPKNWLMNVVFGMAVFFLVTLLYSVIYSLVGRFLPPLGSLLFLFFFLIGMMVLLFAGKANQHTANDNTSGVITLLEILDRIELDQAKVSFILFDNEELGLFGSSAFRKANDKLLRDKVVINFDCVSDGDYLFFVQSKAARPETEPLLKAAFQDEAGKKMRITTSATTLFPSDHWSFKKHIGVVALRRLPVIGYYIPRLHTSRDTIFDRKNIKILADGFADFISQAAMPVTEKIVSSK